MKHKKLATQRIDFNEIDRWLKTGIGTELPNTFKGIFFMDGNTLPDDCITLSARWHPAKRVLKIPVYAPEQWTFHPSRSGRLLLKFINAVQLVYELHFQDDSLRHAVVIPIVFGLRVPRWLIEFTMTQTQDSVDGECWRRENHLLFRLFSGGGYTLRKVVDAQGRKTAAFQTMLTQVQPTCLIRVALEGRNPTVMVA